MDSWAVGGGGEKWRGDLRSPNESAIGLVDISMSALLANLQSPSAFVSQSGFVSAPMRNALLMSGSPFLALAPFFLLAICMHARCSAIYSRRLTRLPGPWLKTQKENPPTAHLRLALPHVCHFRADFHFPALLRYF